MLQCPRWSRSTVSGPAWQPRLLKHRKLRGEQAAFLHGNRDRLQYGTFLSRGYMLGSGPIEARCKQVVQSRLHEAGMHWREHTAEAVLTNRAFLHGTDAGDPASLCVAELPCR